MIAGVFYVVVLAILKFRLVVVPIVLGAIIATVLAPAMRGLVSRGVPRTIASLAVTGGTLLLMVVVLGGIVTFTVMEFDDLRTQAGEGVDSLSRWLIDGPLKLNPEIVDRYPAQLMSKITTNLSSIAGAVLSQVAIGTEILAGVALTIPIVFYFLKDGEKIRDWCLGWVGEENLPRVRTTSMRVWDRFGAFVRGMVIVALFDAVCIGIGLVLIGVPLVLPLAVIVFIGAFIPVIGGVAAGFLAVMVAMVTGGIMDGALTLALILAVQQLDSVVVGPLVLSRAAKIHPLTVLFSLTIGGILGGVVGAFLAMPLATGIVVILQELRHPMATRPSGEPVQASSQNATSPDASTT